MRFIAAVALAITLALIASDLSHYRALYLWKCGRVADGMDMMVMAGRLNPYSIEIRLDEIESLWMGFSKEGRLELLHEATLIGRSLVIDYPGSVQAWNVYASTLIFESVHGGSGDWPYAPAMRAVAMDPISTSTTERAMFFLAAKRMDYETFKKLGIARSRLTREPLLMRCEICGRPWLDHRWEKK